MSDLSQIKVQTANIPLDRFMVISAGQVYLFDMTGRLLAKMPVAGQPSTTTGKA